MSKNILIVGGTSGIGLALTKLLQEQGHQLILASRKPSDDASISNIPHIAWDVSQPLNGQLDQLPETLQGLVYCPGTINLKPFHRLSEEEFLHDFQVNVMGAVRVLQAAMKPLRKARGSSVVMFSTVASRLGMNFHSSIAIAKAGIEGLTKTLAAEWSNYQVRVNAIAPSLTDTPLAEKLLSNEDRREAAAKRHPIGRVGSSEDVAQMAQFLLSDQSTWITGQVLGIDGGMGTLKP